MKNSKETLFTDVLELEARALADCAKRLAQPSERQKITAVIEKMRDRLDQNAKIIVTGVGKSGKIAEKIAATLSSTGSFALYLHPTEGLHGDLGIVREGDVLLAISYTGNTEEIMRLLPSLKRRKVLLIGIGGNAHSVLAEACDDWIDAAVAQEACPHGLAPTASTTLALAIGDAISVTLMKLRGFEAESFAENHPGGALGKRLTYKVTDIMHKEDALPLLAQDATIEEVLHQSTLKKLGAVLITRTGKRTEPLLGIITDGDIRRALHHREKFFQFKAADLMTISPVTCSSQHSLPDALSLMQERTSQISVLPVVDASGKIDGLVRLHDLIRTI